ARPLGAIFDPGVVGHALQGRVGQVWATAGLLLVLAVPVLWALVRQGQAAVGATGWRVSAAAVTIGLLRAPALISHSSEGRQPWLGSAADLVHLGGVAVWLGGLAVMLAVVLPRRRPEEMERLVPMFSKVAFGAVAAIVVAGTFMSWQLVGSVHALVTSRFGRLLLLKIGLFGATLAAARLSKGWVDRRLDLAVLTGADRETVRPFVYSVVAEAGLAIGVLSVAGALVATSPAH
ncbi:MAG TPA: CopD family protein, partial [Acidimicrobiales bacterium]